MRRTSFALLALSLTVASSGADAQQRQRAIDTAGKPESNVPRQEEKRFPLGAAWIAVSMNGKPFTGTERPSFSVAENFRVAGFGGCNSFSTTAYPLKEQGIAVGPLALTKRTCDEPAMAAERAFLGALRTSQKWDTPVGVLVIKGPGGELRFQRSL